MIQWQCSQCGENLEAPESLAGSQLECAICGTVRAVPLPTSLMVESTPVPERAPEPVPVPQREPEAASDSRARAEGMLAQERVMMQPTFVMPPEAYWRKMRSSVANGVMLALLVWSVLGWGLLTLMVVMFSDRFGKQ